MSIDTQTEPQTSTLSSKGMLIGGHWVESASGARITVENPAKRAPIAQVPRGTPRRECEPMLRSNISP